MKVYFILHIDMQHILVIENTKEYRFVNDSRSLKLILTLSYVQSTLLYFSLKQNECFKIILNQKSGNMLLTYL